MSEPISKNRIMANKGVRTLTEQDYITFPYLSSILFVWEDVPEYEITVNL